MVVSSLFKHERQFAFKWKISKDQILKHRCCHKMNSKTLHFREFPEIQFYFQLQRFDARNCIILVNVGKKQENFEMKYKISIPKANLETSINFVASKKDPSKVQFVFNQKDLTNPEFYFDNFITLEIDGLLTTFDVRSEMSNSEERCTVDFASKEKIQPKTELFKRTFLAKCTQFFDLQKHRLKEFQNDVKTRIINLIFRPENFGKSRNLGKLMAKKDEKDVTIFVKNKAIKAKMERFLIQNISPFNVCTFSQAANFTNADTLYKSCAEFLTECFENRIYVSDLDMLDNELKNYLLETANVFVFKSV
uniref:Uncharacterized protein n=1 Tax=Panagrolaimus sp. ES5 TaxID=591445 RepID=A0AC34GV50_9BILA